MPNAPICKDCKHVRPDRSWIFWFSKYRWRYAKCARLMTTSWDPVSGVASEESQYCSITRDDRFNYCGTSGKWFEARNA